MEVTRVASSTSQQSMGDAAASGHDHTRKKMSTVSGKSGTYQLEPRGDHIAENEDDKAAYIAQNKNKVTDCGCVIVS